MMACERLDFADFVRRKVESTRSQIHQIDCVDFPYEAPQEALASLREAFDSYVRVFDEALLDGDDDQITAACKTVNYKIVEYHPILGFLLRATNIRNSFEAYDPLRELAHALLDHKPGVILSSEWDFSPFTYPAISDDLPDFVFIGLPASEAGNALILPLAGHELGHSIWGPGGVGEKLKSSINKTVFSSYLSDPRLFESIFRCECTEDTLLNDPTALSNLTLACGIAGRQCEEVFCDVIGVRLFAEAFIHSFEYLIVPSLGGDRSELYPPLQTRLQYMVKAAESFNQPLDDRHAPPLLERKRMLPAREQFAVRMADTASIELFPSVLTSAKEYCQGRPVAEVSPDIVAFIETAFYNYTPAENARCFGNIISAAWKVYKHFDNFASEIEDRKEAFEILNNLSYKSLEVLEYETKVG